MNAWTFLIIPPRAWAVDDLVRGLTAGALEGLRDELRKLGESV